MVEPGDLIGPYRLISQLGKGAMGEVWRARDERLDRDVAIKVLPEQDAGELELRARMLREARAAAAVRHAHVVTLFDIVAHRGTDILVMELVEGRTLSDTLHRDGPPQLETALRWIHEICDALVAAHARGILHRDIKAANIMISGDGVKILDFGLAKLLHEGPVTIPPGERRAAAVATPDGSLDATVRSGPVADASLDATVRPADASLDATVRSDPARSPRGPIDTYRTQAGQLLGTPLYMAPEQVGGAMPDEQTEVFSVGVLAFEILTGKPPYAAQTIDALFQQIVKDAPPPLPDVPNRIEAIVHRAMAKARAERWPTMRALRDAVAAERKRLFAPPARRWPIAVAAAMLAIAAVVALWWWRSHRTEPVRPGDEYVTRALAEYDVFYNDKALSSLRAALRVAPDHPRANAYMILFGGGSESDLAQARAAAGRARDAATGKDRTLLDAAIALVDRGPAAARAAIVEPADRELAFWAAELDYRAGHYAIARDEYRALLADPATALRGRIYDHDSAVLLYLDEPDEALRVGTLYRDAFPGEADAVGVYATTLAAVGKFDEAIAAAEEALRLAEGEDTLAGLAKVVALSGDRKRAKELYQRSLERAGASRRPVRRAALALLQWIDGDPEAAKTVAPCLPGGSDAAVRERGACLFVAGVIEPARAPEVAAELDKLAAEATDVRPAYGAPASLAQLVRARATFFGGACIAAPDPATHPDRALEAAYRAPLDFYAAYHVPFVATWAACEHAALLAALGDRSGAAAVLRPIATRAPNRSWLLQSLRRYE
ncbi:MAG TPA: serine/threonine-protein kinase [Kofleriaceae bacterium]|nr:serine/threonine-protein kinase [Kofleriaceae bacterium]